MARQILVVDDDADWRSTYSEWLEEDGYTVATASSLADAKAWLTHEQAHVVILDQKLEGPGGRDVGIGLLGWLRDNAPATRTLLVTGFASKDAVERAFREGVFDYLEKTEILEALLRIKVRQASDSAVAAMGTSSVEAREQELRDGWAAALAETHSQRKGALLEQAIKLLVSSVPGLAHARTNVGNETEEIDILVTNRSTDPLLDRQGDFFVIECKNWTSVVGTEVVSRLREKVSKRYGRARLGLCVAMGGFAGTVSTDLLAERRGEILLLTLDRADIDTWIAATDRAAWLVERIGAAVAG